MKTLSLQFFRKKIKDGVYIFQIVSITGIKEKKRTLAGSFMVNKNFKMRINFRANYPLLFKGLFKSTFDEVPLLSYLYIHKVFFLCAPALLILQDHDFLTDISLQHIGEDDMDNDQEEHRDDIPEFDHP